MEPADDLLGRKIEHHQFKSMEEMESFKLQRDLQTSDLERFKTFVALMKLGRKLKNAPKIHKQIG